MPEPIVTITGPTAVGKTDVSLDIARLLDAEIISADSRQIYRNLDIGTAKPTRRQLESAVHHFVDELDLSESYSAGQFALEARDRIQDIRQRGRRVIVVGGSTLYLAALQKGLADIPRIDPSVREQLQLRLSDVGADNLYDELVKVDPLYANTLDPTKTQRIVRGLEVFVGTGQPISSYFAARRYTEFKFVTAVLTRPRDVLHERINARVDRMVASGIVEETKAVLETGVDPASNPMNTIGYRECIAYLGGEINLEEAVRLMARNTRRYAKRQETWLRRYDEYVWVDADTNPDTILRRLSDTQADRS